MMLVLALGTQAYGSDAHITTPCFACGRWNRPTRRIAEKISLACNTLVVTHGTELVVTRGTEAVVRYV